jgi:hypothetical protein
MVDKEPVLRTKNGRSFAFSPDWYPVLVKMCNASLDMLGFGPEMVLSLATGIYATKMLIEGERSWRSEREGMTRTMKRKIHPPPT